MGYRYDAIYAFILYSGILGFLFGILYDFFRIIRLAFTVPGIIGSGKCKKVHKHGVAVNILVFVCDILFFVIAGCITAIFIFHANDGKIRGIALFGSLVGFVIYYNTVGRLVTRISSFIIKTIYSCAVFVLNQIIKPFFAANVKMLFRLYYLALSFARKLYTYRVKLRILRRAKRGFR